MYTSQVHDTLHSQIFELLLAVSPFIVLIYEVKNHDCFCKSHQCDMVTSFVFQERNAMPFFDLRLNEVVPLLFTENLLILTFISYSAFSIICISCGQLYRRSYSGGFALVDDLIVFPKPIEGDGKKNIQSFPFYTKHVSIDSSQAEFLRVWTTRQLIWKSASQIFIGVRNSGFTLCAKSRDCISILYQVCRSLPVYFITQAALCISCGEVICVWSGWALWTSFANHRRK